MTEQNTTYRPTKPNATVLSCVSTSQSAAGVGGSFPDITQLLCVYARLPYLWQSEASKFWQQVDKSDVEGCWPWLGYTHTTSGRALVQFAGKLRHATRVAYQLSRGVLLGNGKPQKLNVCHSCDNPLCCRPDHLFLADQKTNIRDAVAKGRFLHHRKLSPQQVKEIIHALSESRKEKGIVKRLATQYGIHYSTIYQILRGETWRDTMPIQPDVTTWRQRCRHGRQSKTIGSTSRTSVEVLL